MSIESHLASESPKNSRHFKDVVKHLFSSKKESEDIRPWRWEDEISGNEWLKIKQYFKQGTVEKIWEGIDQRIYNSVLFPNDNDIIKSFEEIKRDILQKRSYDSYGNIIPDITKIRIRENNDANQNFEDFIDFLKNELNECRRNKDFKELFFIACVMRILSAYKVELTKDNKILITDKPPAPNLNTEIPKRPTRIKKL